MIAAFLLVGNQPYARHMVESIKDVYGCKVVQLSDLGTQPIDGVDEVIRRPFRIPLMLYRLKHLALLPVGDTLIVDTDVIAKKPIDLWSRDFDVVLTRREAGKLVNDAGIDMAPDMPFNTGVMLCRNPKFWTDCWEWLAKQADPLHHWYGDQYAVSAIANRDTYDVLQVPCSRYNWSPNSREDISDAYFWHYKGAVRKKWIHYSSVTTQEKLPLTTSLQTALLNTQSSPSASQPSQR